jgi:hypothetical protein
MQEPHHLRFDAGAIIVNSEQEVVIIEKLDDQHFVRMRKATFWETPPLLRSESKL